MLVKIHDGREKESGGCYLVEYPRLPQAEGAAGDGGGGIR